MNIKTVLSRIGALSAVVALCALASAATQVSIGPKPAGGIDLRVGGFLPSSNGWSTKYTTFSVGADYDIKAPTLMGNTTSWLSISADYFNPQGNRDIPVMIMANAKSNNYTTSIGIGVEDTQFSGRSSYIRFAAQAAYTYDLKMNSLPLFIQGKYFYSSNSEFRGVGLYLGARF